MVKSNEFSGRSLRDAVSAATEAYRGGIPIEAKSFCRDLRSRFDLRKRDADHIHDRIVDMQRDVDGLRQAAKAEALITVVTALGASVAALGRIARIVRRFSAAAAKTTDIARVGTAWA